MTTLHRTDKVYQWLKNQHKPKTQNMFELLKQLAPHQRAILHQALLNYKQEAENMLADSHDRNANHAHRIPLDWLANETGHLMTTLFSEAFLDDLEPLDHFLAQQRERQNAAGNIAGIP